MPKTEMVAPTFQELTASDATQEGNIALQFKADDGNLYRVEIAKAIVGATVLNIIGQLNKLRPATLEDDRRQSDRIMSLHLTALRPMLTAKGELGLAMVLEESLEVGLQLKRDAIPVLKNVLDQLYDLTAPPTGASEH